MSEPARSEQACPVCGQHTLALDRPPEIDVMGVQQYNDLLGMGDLQVEGAIGIVCLSCGTHWRDKEALDHGEPDPGEPYPLEGSGEDTADAIVADEGDIAEAGLGADDGE